MSDGMTDKRSQSEPILTLANGEKLQVMCHDRFFKFLVNNPEFDSFTLKQARNIAENLASQVRLAAVDLTS